MTRAHYYSTTKSLTANLFKYGLYPITYAAAFSATKGNEAKSTALASVITGVCSALLTTDYFGKEAAMLLSNAREPVAAELGMDAKDVQFSDLYKSHNTIVRKELQDLMHLQKIRYATDSIFLVPAALMALGKVFPPMRDFLPGGTPPKRSGRLFGSMRDAAKAAGQNPITSAMLGYAGMSAYWYLETMHVSKSAHYELVKARENIESTHSEVSANDILRIYQRDRVDHGKWMLTHDGGEIQALMPLLQRMADLCNSTANWGAPELLYLIGTGKINILDDKGHIDPAAIGRSGEEIDTLAKLGFAGIAEANKHDPVAKRRREAPTSALHKLFDGGYDAFSRHKGSRNRTYEEIISSKNRNTASDPHFEELVSSRDPASTVYTGRG